MSQVTHCPDTPARCVRVPAHRACLAAVLAATCGFAQAPADDPVARLLAVDAATLVRSPVAVVRGEAALVLACSGDPVYYGAVAAVARDPDPEASLRGIVALGHLAVPGTEVLLERILLAGATRPTADTLAAALALGMLPEDHAPSAVSGHLNRFLQSSYKRQRDVLLALLCGLGSRSATNQQRAMLGLLDDAANRDPRVRGGLLLALSRIEGALPADRIQRVLQHGAAEERTAALMALLQREPEPDLLPLLVQLTRRDPSPEVRALALKALTAARHLPALDLAARALRSAAAVEVEQGTRSAVLLGGLGMRRAIESELPDLPPASQAAVLRALDGPIGDELAATCRKLAADRANALELRLSAAMALARSDQNSAVPLLRDLFGEVEDIDELLRIATELLRLEERPTDLERLHGGRAGDLLQQPNRLAALLRAGHPGASRFCLAQLQEPGLLPAEQARLLLAFRKSRLPPLEPHLLHLLPEPLRQLEL